MTRFLRSFGFAFAGLVDATRVQPNLAVHWVIAAAVLLATIVFHVPLWGFVVILVLAGLVVAFELANTALEAHVDLVTREFHPLAKRAKDAAAGSVLAMSVTAALGGVAVFVGTSGEAAEPRAALDVQTAVVAAALCGVATVLVSAWLGERLAVPARLAVVAALWAGSVCLCLLAHGGRVL